jgi:hypothetical protein
MHPKFVPALVELATFRPNFRHTSEAEGGVAAVGLMNR